jgi:hypothetical protein
VKNGQTGGSKISWRVFVKDEHPELQDNAEDTRIFVDVMKGQYTTNPTYVYLEDDTEFCLRVYKGLEAQFGNPDGANRIVLSKGSNVYVDILISDVGQDYACFRTPSAPKIERQMCIYSKKAAEPEGPDGTFLGNILDAEWGHAAIALVYTSSYSDTPWIKTYGKRPRYGVIEDDCNDWPGNLDYKYYYCQPITYQQWKAAENYVKTQGFFDSIYTLTNNCASFASDIFKATTNIDINADDNGAMKSETPHEVGRSIIIQNGGSYGSFPVFVENRACENRKNLRG